MRRVYMALQGLAATVLLAPLAFASEGAEGGKTAGGVPLASNGLPNPAAGWDHLWAELMIDLIVIGVLFGGAALYMLLKYQAKSPEEQGTGPRLSKVQAIGWALIPAFVFMSDDLFLAAKGWSLWSVYRNPPANSLEVKLTAVQWGWSYKYPNGVETDVLRFPSHKPVVLRMTSEDVIHSYWAVKYRVKEDVMPGRITYVWFNPVNEGKTYVTCTEFCGTGHSQMYGDIISMPQGEYDAWMTSQVAPAAAPAPAPAS